MDFADRRPEDNKKNAITALVGKAKRAAPVDRPGVYTAIVREALPVPSS